MVLHTFLLLFFTWLASQSLKFLFSTYNERKLSKKHAYHVYLFASGVPSTHTAVLTASCLMIAQTQGTASPLFYVMTLFTILWLFEIYMQRKRFNALLEILQPNMGKMESKLLKDLSGHDLIDMVAGGVVGVVVFLVMTYFV